VGTDGADAPSPSAVAAGAPSPVAAPGSAPSPVAPLAPGSAPSPVAPLAPGSAPSPVAGGAPSPVAPHDAADAAAPASPLAPPRPARATLLGLPPGAAVTFAGRRVEADAIHGAPGETGDLDVRAPGFEPYREPLTLADGLAVDLRGRLRRRVSPPSAPAKRAATADVRTIEGSRRGSRIKILSE
jgi:hypothetical protein